MRWESFEQTCPDIATLARQRFERDELVMLGTLRRDGAPRISPCELDFVSGELMLGMMWRSPKALDLRRDPRIVVHSVACDRMNPDGDVKIGGRVEELWDAGLRERYREAVRRRIDWAPEEPEYHLFRLEVEHAAYLVFRDEREHGMAWDPQGGLRRWEKAG